MVRLMPAVALVVAFGIGFAMVAGAGFSGALGGGSNNPLADDVESAGEESSGNVTFDPDDGGDSFLGSTVSTVRGVIGVLQLVLYFPTTLQTLGMPAFAANPIGWGLEILFAIGVYQIIRGDRVR